MSTIGGRGAGRLGRIMLALDALNCETDLIEAAAWLAARLDAELDALFVEDDDVFAVAELPITQEISLSTGRERDISGRRVAQTLRGLSRDAERRFAAIMQRRHMRGSFRVMRARREQAIAEAAREVALLLLQPCERTLVRVRSSDVAPARLMVLCGQTPTPAARRAIEVAARLARGATGVLELIVAGELDGALRAELEASGLTVIVHGYPARTTLTEMLAAVDNRPCSTLLIPGDLFDGSERERVLGELARLRCQALLVN